ncbi:MAG: sulfate ABC transporter permease subunit CysW [Spirochaetes bacterium]|nr:sulfate ABC transporter permease subunit CysW [Spirochaetota bacterium]
MATYRPASGEPVWVRRALILLVVALMGLLLALPLATVFIEALRKGAGAYLGALRHPDALDALRLTLFAAAIAVPFNLVFGVATAWALARFEFPGKSLVASAVDLPLWISPVVSGLLYVILCGAQGLLGPALSALGIRVIFTPFAIVLATIFVTIPYVARNVLPLMESLGRAEEEAALTLGARGFQVLWRVTLPKIQWGLLYGVILCTARAVGEFGAVSVVSGHIRGVTNTLPLHIEILYSEYQVQAAFAVATLLTLLALATLGVKAWVEWRQRLALAAVRRDFAEAP